MFLGLVARFAVVHIYRDRFSRSVGFRLIRFLPQHTCFRAFGTDCRTAGVSLLSSHAGREVARNTDKLNSGIRKWLTYMAMLIAAGVILGDLIYFLNHFLRGELTMRFVLKSLAVFSLAGCVLWYHLGAVGQSVDLGKLVVRDRVYATVLLASDLVSIGFGFWQLGSPATSRLIEADLQRSTDLQSIASRLQASWTTRKSLPATLDDLSPVCEFGIRSRDNPTNTGERMSRRMSPAPSFPRNDRPTSDWNLFLGHSKGRQCFIGDASAPRW